MQTLCNACSNISDLHAKQKLLDKHFKLVPMRLNDLLVLIYNDLVHFVSTESRGRKESKDYYILY